MDVKAYAASVGRGEMPRPVGRSSYYICGNFPVHLSSVDLGEMAWLVSRDQS
jgi:hypothetical protein